MSSDMVRVYDSVTKAITTIPAAELAPGMVRVRLVGVEGEVWIDRNRTQSKYNQTPIYPPFGCERKELMASFAALFADVYPQTAEEWEYGFQCDVNCDSEIALWLEIACAFVRFTSGRGYCRDQKADIIQVILACTNSGPSRVLQTLSIPHTLSRNRVKEIIAYMAEREKQWVGGEPPPDLRTAAKPG